MPLVTIERRAEPFFPFRRCLCMDNRQGTFIAGLFAFISSLIMLICVALDQYATDHPAQFQIPGGFQSTWREMQWKSWVACNATMLVCHSISVVISVVLVLAIRMPDKPIGKLYNLVVVVRGWYIWMWMYIIAELGVMIFEYSWYGWHVFRLPFTCFVFVWWVLKTIFNLIFVFVAMSYDAEAKEELHEGMEDYGEASAAELYKSQMLQQSQQQQPPAPSMGGSGYMGPPGPAPHQMTGLQGPPIQPAPGFTQPYGTMGPSGAPSPQQGYYPPYAPYGAPAAPPGFAAPPPAQPAWQSSQTNLVSPGTPSRPVSGIQQFPMGAKGQQINVDSHEDDF